MKKGERRKSELLHIAYTRFLENGYEQTSVDEIINEAQIAKGTFYHYFQSKEQILEQVVEMVLQRGLERANGVLCSALSVPEKIIGVILAFRPVEAELVIQNTLNKPENVLLHDRVNRRLIADATPLLAEIVREGIRQGIFDCEQVEERVKLILIMSSRLFDDGAFSENETIAFIDIVEKTIGAKSGTMDFIKKLISGGQNDDEHK